MMDKFDDFLLDRVFQKIVDRLGEKHLDVVINIEYASIAVLFVFFFSTLLEGGGLYVLTWVPTIIIRIINLKPRVKMLTSLLKPNLTGLNPLRLHEYYLRVLALCCFTLCTTIFSNMFSIFLYFLLFSIHLYLAACQTQYPMKPSTVFANAPS